VGSLLDFELKRSVVCPDSGTTSDVEGCCNRKLEALRIPPQLFILNLAGNEILSAMNYDSVSQPSANFGISFEDEEEEQEYNLFLSNLPSSIRNSS
jgi:hypothetical protein